MRQPWEHNLGASEAAPQADGQQQRAAYHRGPVSGIRRSAGFDRRLRRLRLPVGLAFFQLESLAYLAVNRVSSRLPSLPLMTQADESIPLREQSLWLYLSFVPFCLISPYEFDGVRRSFRICSCLMLSSLVAYRSFLRSPTTYPRPEVHYEGDPHLQHVFGELHAIDRPSNCFPSIHVSHAVLIALMLAEHVSEERAHVYLSWACAIGLSTLLTKQHFILDISGGVLVAETIARDIYEPWTRGTLSLRAAMKSLRRLCRELDALVANKDSGPLTVTERHPRIQAWGEKYRSARSFAELYRRSVGRHEIVALQARLARDLEQLLRGLRVVNRVTPGWLRFIEDFCAAGPKLGDQRIEQYLADLDQDMARLWPLVVALVAKERPEATTPAGGA